MLSNPLLQNFLKHTFAILPNTHTIHLQQLTAQTPLKQDLVKLRNNGQCSFSQQEYHTLATPHTSNIIQCKTSHFKYHSECNISTLNCLAIATPHHSNATQCDPYQPTQIPPTYTMPPTNTHRGVPTALLQLHVVNTMPRGRHTSAMGGPLLPLPSPVAPPLPQSLSLRCPQLQGRGWGRKGGWTVIMGGGRADEWTAGR